VTSAPSRAGARASAATWAESLPGRIEEGDQRRPRRGDAGIAGGRGAAIDRMANQPQAWIAKCQDRFGAIIGGAVIDQDQFPIGKILTLHAGDGPRQGVRAVIEGNDNRNDRRGRNGGHGGSEWMVLPGRSPDIGLRLLYVILPAPGTLC